MITLPRSKGLPRPRRSVLAVVLGLLLATSLLSACAANSSAASTNHRNTTQQAARRLTYVAIGASDAFGVGTGDPKVDNWPTVLTHDLGSSVHLVNLGIPGITVAGARNEELPVAVGSDPDIVTVWLAVNDVAARVPLDTYRQQLNALLGSLKQKTHARIFVGNLPDLTLLPFFASANQALLSETIQTWNVAIGQVVAANNATLIDLFSQWHELALHPEYLAPDGLHPSTVGAQRLAAVFAAVIGPTTHEAGRP